MITLRPGYFFSSRFKELEQVLALSGVLYPEKMNKNVQAQFMVQQKPLTCPIFESWLVILLPKYQTLTFK